jgi:hypothetical protein
MTNLQRRLRKLEGQLTDGSGLVPHSQKWLHHWEQRIYRMLTGKEPGAPGCIPLEAYEPAGRGGPLSAASTFQNVNLNPSWIRRASPEPTTGLPTAKSGVMHPQPKVEPLEGSEPVLEPVTEPNGLAMLG